jgi:hypothetical protein
LSVKSLYNIIYTLTKGKEMPYFKFTASTPYCGEEMTDYIEVAEDDLNSVDEIADQLASDVADTFWHGGEEDEDGNFTDGCYTQEDYYAECSCSYEEITKEEFEART